MNDEFNEVCISPEQIAASLGNSNELVAIALIDGQPARFACAQYYKSFCYLTDVDNIAAIEAYGKCGFERDTVVMLDKQLVVNRN